MKTYKLTDAINALEKNPYTAFKRIGDGLELRVKQTSHGMALSWDSGYQFLGFNDEFEEIIKSVSWESAFKAWSKGYPIRVRSGGKADRRISTYDSILTATRYEIRESEWFIENVDTSAEEEK